MSFGKVLASFKTLGDWLTQPRVEASVMHSGSQWLTDEEIQVLYAQTNEILKTLKLGLLMSDATQQGAAQSRSLGAGMEFAESQVYQPGDDIRFLDWRLMARKQQAYTKWFEPERLASWCLLLDESASMRFGTRRYLKVQQAVRAFGALNLLAQKSQAQVQWVKLHSDLDRSAFLSGRDLFAQAMAFANVMSALNPAVAKESMGRAESSQPLWLGVLTHISASLPKHSQLVLISDLHDLNLDEPTTFNVLGYLAQQFRVSVVFIEDAVERQLPELSEIRLTSLDHQQSMALRLSQMMEFAHRASQQLDAKQQALIACGVHLVVWRTDDSLEELFARWEQMA